MGIACALHARAPSSALSHGHSYQLTLSELGAIVWPCQTPSAYATGALLRRLLCRPPAALPGALGQRLARTSAVVGRQGAGASTCIGWSAALHGVGRFWLLSRSAPPFTWAGARTILRVRGKLAAFRMSLACRHLSPPRRYLHFRLYSSIASSITLLIHFHLSRSTAWRTGGWPTVSRCGVQRQASRPTSTSTCGYRPHAWSKTDCTSPLSS